MPHPITLPRPALGLLLCVASLPALAASADDITVDGAYVREVPPMVHNSAAFMTLSNSSDTDAALVAVHSMAADTIELHTHINDDGVMRMRQIPEITVAAGATTKLQPGGLHVMLLGLTAPLQQGRTVSLELEFADGSRTRIEAPVMPVMSGMRHGHHGKHH